MDTVEKLSTLLTRFPGVGPRQAKRFVYHLLSVPASERDTIAALIQHLTHSVSQCISCFRYAEVKESLCQYCRDRSRDRRVLMIVEKDQDLLAVERSGAYKGTYFVLGGSLSLSNKGVIREKELIEQVDHRTKEGLSEIIMALSATAEGEHTKDRVIEVLAPLRSVLTISTLGRGLSTGSELEYADKETLSSAFLNRKET